MKLALQVIAALALLVSVGCSSPVAWSRHEMCFGLSSDSGKTVFSDQEWQSFVDREIVPRFPDGFTILKGKGYWRHGQKTVTEPSRILMILAPDVPETRRKLDAIAQEYIQQFHQDAVLRITTSAAVEFHE